MRLLDPMEIKIGTVRPFIVTAAEASNVIGAGRRVTVTFSKSLARDVTNENTARWARLDPVPENLQIKVASGSLVFTGDFGLDIDYRVIVEAGLPAAEPFVLAQEFSKAVHFSEVPPRLYFEEFATHQLSTGSRQFHLLADECAEGRGSARESSPVGGRVPLALDAYRDATCIPIVTTVRRRKSNDPFEKLALDRLPGQTTWQRELDGTKQVDQKRDIALNWNEILGANKTGVVLLTAEQAGVPAKLHERPGVQSIVQVTDLGTAWKTSKDENLVHVFSLANGQAIAGTKLRALDGKGHTVAEATADADGVARLKGGEGADWILAVHGPDTHLVDFRNHSESLSLRRLGIRETAYEGEGVEEACDALLFTERPVYKPGDTVHLKGIVRDWRNDHPHLPAGAKATLRLSDSQNRHLVDRTVTLSDAGSLAEDFRLPTSGLGTYRLELVMADADPTDAHVRTGASISRSRNTRPTPSKSKSQPTVTIGRGNENRTAHRRPILHGQGTEPGADDLVAGRKRQRLRSRRI